MSIEHALNEHTIRVNNGTGCIFQPATTEFSYVLTARHNLKKEDKASYDEYPIIKNSNNKTIKVIESIIHDYPQIDIAVHKIEFQNISSKCLPSTPKQDLSVYIYGYPKFLKKQDRPNKATDLNGTVGIQPDPYGIYAHEINFTPNLSGRDNKANENVLDFSGSGVFEKEHNGILKLKGIYARLLDSDGALGKGLFYTLEIFNVLLKSNGWLELEPNYMTSFEFLKEEAFKLNIGAISEGNLMDTQDSLRTKTSGIIESQITPKYIKGLFKEKLLIDERQQGSIFDKKLWKAWLELLTILNITHDNPEYAKNLVEIFDSHRLKYLDCKDDWTNHLPEIYHSNYKGIKKNGSIIIESSSISRETKSLERGKIPKNIGRVYHLAKVQTDSNNNPQSDFNIYHMDYIREQTLLDNQNELSNLETPEDILKALKKEYGKLFR